MDLLVLRARHAPPGSKRLADIGPAPPSLADGVELPPVMASLDQVGTRTMTGPVRAI